MNRLALAIATWFGCGYFPAGPGTAGSLGALLVAWLLTLAGLDRPWHFLVLALAFTGPGIWASTATARLKGLKDPQIVVVDEVLGQWITLAGAATLDLVHFGAAFVLFRLFDIVKPWPVRRLEKLPEGTGIVADGLAAGVLGAVVLLVAGWFNS
jgi:phosphatidylglycerophosphatase A